MKSLLFVKNFSLVLTRLIIGVATVLLISSFLSRTLGQEVNGIYVLAILCTMLAVAIGGMGVHSASVYFVSRAGLGWWKLSPKISFSVYLKQEPKWVSVLS